MSNIVVFAPHPDDETLGCGGTLLKHQKAGNFLHWIIMTSMDPKLGYSEKAIKTRQEEIELVSKYYDFKTVTQLEFSTASLDTYPLSSILEKVDSALNQINPEIVYIPFESDVHTDHCITAKAVYACCKTFRRNTVKKILSYETLSETEFASLAFNNVFRPNVFVDIEDYLDKKIEIFKTYKSEIKEFPFPRSANAIRTLANFRGLMANFKTAESFMLLKEISE